MNKERRTLHVSADLHDNLKRLAAATGMKLESVTNDALQAFLDRHPIESKEKENEKQG